MIKYGRAGYLVFAALAVIGGVASLIVQRDLVAAPPFFILAAIFLFKARQHAAH